MTLHQRLCNPSMVRLQRHISSGFDSTGDYCAGRESTRYCCAFTLTYSCRPEVTSSFPNEASVVDHQSEKSASINCVKGV